ncbi:flagellin lysine-N-methylase [Massilia sp. BHUDP2]|uniref:flagellin lysine-N-methylase n=1 Tax=Massilia sp. BHUDP2 TaxID=3034505 RepID=UPI001AEB27C5
MAILHRTRTYPSLIPRYVERFRCLGPTCEDTCCASWPIHIDKKTYKAYRQDSAHELGKTLSKSLVRTENNLGSIAYAAILPEGEEQKCPVMKDGLCSIHAQLGESYISDLCFTYPRVTQQVDGQMEQALTLSCPEAARQALLAEDAFDFVEGSVSLREAMVSKLEPGYGLSMATMNEIRIFCLNLLRTRELALWQRLALLGVFTDDLSRHCAQGRQAELPAMLEQFIGLVESGAALAALDAIQPNHTAQAMVFATLWAAKGFATPSRFQQGVIRQLSARMGADDNGQTSAEALVAAYRQGLDQLDRVLEDAPFMLENYLANEMFMHFFPFSAPNPYDSYLHLVARFGLLRFLLASYCNTEQPPSVSELISVVHLHCRRFQHDNTYSRQLHTSLHESGWAGLDKLYCLLRT